ISTVALPQLVTGAIVVLALIWSVNLYNFMDGIDGLAASQAIFISGAGWILGQESSSIWQTLAVATAGSSTGFLLWNWPPARIFLGDTGSGFLGFWLASLGLGMHVSGTLPIWSFALLGAVFIADSATTLIRRMLRGDR